MKLKNLSRWRLAPELDGLLFFAQRMDELLWDYTLDTHKPMALNASSLCDEAIAVIGNIDEGLIEPANLKPVLEELVWSIQNDPVAKSLLDLPIERYVALTDKVNHADIKIKIQTLGRTLGSYRYLHKCLDFVSENVKKCNKKSIDWGARSLVTTLTNMGLSKRSIFFKNNSFFFAPNGVEIHSKDQIDDFLKTIYPFAHEFHVYMIVSNLIKEVEGSVKNFKLELLDKLPDDILKLQMTVPDFTVSADECYVCVGPIHELDIFTAQQAAAKQLDQLSDLFTVFYHQNRIKWKDVSLVRQCCLEKPVSVRLSSGAMRKPFDLHPQKAAKELNKLLGNLSIRGSSFDRFVQVADLHGICVFGEIIENQLVTLWTALETLIPSHSKTSKVVNIQNGLIPFLMRSYVRRLIERFTHDLIVWKPWYVKRLLNKVPGSLPARLSHKVLRLLVVQENLPLRNELYTELKDFHLLRFRAFQLSEMLKTPRSLKEALTAHEKKVCWQIRRIYRTRNLIVHSGKKPSYIHTIVENAHDYLDQVFFDVMKLSCGDYRAQNLEQVFELAKNRHDSFFSSLNKLTAFNAENCIFLCEDVDVLGDFKNELWAQKNKMST